MGLSDLLPGCREFISYPIKIYDLAYSYLISRLKKYDGTVCILFCLVLFCFKTSNNHPRLHLSIDNSEDNPEDRRSCLLDCL